MKYSSYDKVLYVHSSEFADSNIMASTRKEETAKVYVYETGKMYISDGTTFHEIGVADA